MSIDFCVGQLLAYAEKYLGLDPRDEVYARNRVLDILGKADYASPSSAVTVPERPDPIFEGIFAALEGEGKEFDRIALADRLADAVMLRPSEYEARFAEHYQVSTAAATDWAYAYAVHSNYVKKSAIDRNIRWSAANGLEITINLSKPEKNNRDLAKQLAAPSNNYPQCTICRENEGYERPGFSRRNLRTCSLRLAGEDWFWQYSPYAYFAEHGIAIRCEHTPMVLDEKTAVRLFDFAEQFPQYFIGNNAPLPRVGGSILMHDHFQGGLERLPMQRAGIRLPLLGPAAVRAGVVDWFNTAIRLEGDDRRAVEAAAYSLVEAWRQYRNEALDILPYTGQTPHNTASLIARKAASGYILDIILRNNRTSDRYPDGIFHAHREYHHIKSESIGLIEAMGLFILPARLRRQLGVVEEYLSGVRAWPAEELAEDMRPFAPMIGRLFEEHGTVSAAQAKEVIRRDVEDTCRAILDNTAVFKRDEAGENALIAFLSDAGFPAKRRNI